MFTSQFWLATGIIAVLSYLLGSLNFALLISKGFAGDDVRRHGSGNAGMTNMLRTYGKGMAAYTAAGDFLKAVVAVVLSRLIFGGFGLSESPLDAGYISGLFVLMGHMFPVFFHFKGGKGVMATLGVVFTVNPLVFLIIAAIFIPFIFIVKIVSLASLLGAILFPILTWLLAALRGRPALYDTVCAGIFSLIILLGHRDNIKRLLSGTENKFGTKKENK